MQEMIDRVNHVLECWIEKRMLILNSQDRQDLSTLVLEMIVQERRQARLAMNEEMIAAASQTRATKVEQNWAKFDARIRQLEMVSHFHHGDVPMKFPDEPVSQPADPVQERECVSGCKL
jgi:hypothetical protein